MPNVLETLKKHSVIVADTGEISLIKQIKPQDATTNPSLILQAAGKEEYRHLIADAVARAKKTSGTEAEQIDNIMDRLAVNFGTEILNYIPGYVSTEIDAALSFNTNAMVERAKKIIRLYEENGVSKNRILVKIATTWEGIKAAAHLKKDAIKVNMTLLFSHAQALACAENELFLISPFVGRILDWHKAKNPTVQYTAKTDPGVLFVKSVYQHYKSLSYDTIVMAASFRNTGQILELAGCDRLTISPTLIKELEKNSVEPTTTLAADSTHPPKSRRIHREDEFRNELNDDLMATEKLAEGILKFKQDYNTLKNVIVKNYL